MKTAIVACVLFLSTGSVVAQQQGFVHEQSEANGYVWPEDVAVMKHLDEWRDLKFGVIFHWGLYSVPGIVESWSICSEDVDWINRDLSLPYDEYKQWYWGLKDTFNPIGFDASKWSSIMKDAGMKYMIFTTKHHDGFCMFDSGLTDFSIANGAFARDDRSNVAREVFDAFRKEGFMTGAYFSKPDWHCEWFWNPQFATPGRHINYKKERHPDWWKNYQDFTAGQLGELLSGDYGKLDILWLDGGWIAGDDVGLDSILADARKELHPGLISVDRTIRGKNENYQTPERGIPDKQLNYPWESCITLSNDWGWVPDAPYKSPGKVIGMLAEITAKGGSLLLGIGPDANGEIEKEIVWRLGKIGEWLGKNGEAIYSTRNAPVYNSGNTWFTASKDGKFIYAIYVPDEDSDIPATIEWEGNVPTGKMTLLDGNRSVKYKVQGDKVVAVLPKGLPKMPVALKFQLKPYSL